ncbi:MAG: response regulator [Oscillospiraceae bacterium]|nr:response regulator [Oscillospiraceae bacterium]
MMEQPVKRSILIIDDEKPNLNVLGHTLRQEYTVYTARDGKTGLEIANEYLPDLVLLDIIMPEMDGYEVLTKLKESDKTKDIPVVFITGLVSSESVQKGMSMGAADYIFKPFSASNIKEKVEGQLRSSSDK